MYDAILGPLAREVVWKVNNTPVAGQMADLMADQWDINKFEHYLPVYESVFDASHHDPIRLLEIGVSFGGSLELWRRYFTHWNTTIVGIDTNPECAVFDDPGNNVHVRIGAQQDIEFLGKVVDEFGPFDVIIDDGSHIPAYTLASFTALFDFGLSHGGAYLVEDLHTCYAADVPDKGAPPFTEVLKHLIDMMHRHYEQTPTGDEFAAGFEPDNPGYQSEWAVPLATMLVDHIEIHDALAVIYKGPRRMPRMIRRWSRERMTAILNPDAARFLHQHPHLGNADRQRHDWFSPPPSAEPE
jgi:hypothetical protein